MKQMDDKVYQAAKWLYDNGVKPDMIEEPRTDRFADLSPREQKAVLARVMRNK